MITVRDTLEQNDRLNALLQLVHDLDTVVGVRMITNDTAEVWIAAPNLRELIADRCAASDNDLLTSLKFEFRDVVSDATAGGAASRPKHLEPPTDEHGSDTPTGGSPADLE